MAAPKLQQAPRARRQRDPEQEIDVDHLDPIAAIRRLAELTFDHHEANPSFLRDRYRKMLADIVVSYLVSN